MNRQEALGRLRRTLDEGGVIMGAGAGTGLRAAREADLLTTPYIFDADQARAMAAAGADVVVAHMGLTTKGAIGATTALALDESAARIQAIRDAAAAVNPGIIVLCHGGPIAEPDDTQYILDHTSGVAGFFGASSMERLPTEVAITENMRRFKRIARTAIATG